ncbi:LysR family transcriptional regulator [Bermanella marisrubri]|uniref:Probable transcriptional regulator, LysR family protein n=1 Tax=Bermanella marisrubri TaxID=207949 RepID=Q1MY79_9GAMM|nr:LysR family transcriptional regulator [Bermanella marisrubri]EAT10931.1 probable transcriptional regulator, LysR family protein [Oceanobacter sp. RED65] [Bermanella marisrubri]QIZ83726.1 LysR family transcriptional regulator [Bermanella marisrubri]
MDTLDTIRAFIAVAAEGSFTKAADRLDTSPQLISKYMGQLESRLNIRLLNRTTRKVQLTEAGAAYLEQAQDLINRFDAMENEIGDLQTLPQGNLRISAPVSFANLHMGALLREFQSLYPDISIDLQLNDRKVDIVEEGYDVALRIGQLQDSSLIAKYIAPIQLRICASKDYLQKNGIPKTEADLKQHTYLSYSYAEQNQSIFKNAKTVITCNNGDILVDHAIAGSGIAMQPTFICGEALKRGDLVSILENYTPKALGLYAMYAHRKFIPLKVRCFLDFIGGYFGEAPYWD